MLGKIQKKKTARAKIEKSGPHKFASYVPKRGEVVEFQGDKFGLRVVTRVAKDGSFWAKEIR